MSERPFHNPISPERRRRRAVSARSRVAVLAGNKISSMRSPFLKGKPRRVISGSVATGGPSSSSWTAIWRPANGGNDWVSGFTTKVEAQKALRDGMANKVRDNFRHDVIDWRDNVRREDSAGAALYELAPTERRPETLRLVSLPNEINLYQTRAVLTKP